MPPLSPARRQGLGAKTLPHPCRELIALQGRQGAESSPQAAAGRTNPLTASPGKFRLLAVDKRNGEGVKPRLGRPPKAADGA